MSEQASADLTPPNVPSTVPAAPAPPPAAKIVVNAERTERELELEAELERERQARKKAETDAAYAKDEAFRLKQIPAATSSPANKPKKSKDDAWSLFEAMEEEEGEEN